MSDLPVIAAAPEAQSADNASITNEDGIAQPASPSPQPEPGIAQPSIPVASPEGGTPQTDLGIETTAPRTHKEGQPESFADSVERSLRELSKGKPEPEQAPNEPDPAPAAETPTDTPATDPKADSPDTKTDAGDEVQDADEPASDQPADPTDILPDEEEVKDWTPKAAKRFIAIKEEVKTLKQALEAKDTELAASQRQMEELKGSLQTEDMAELQQKLADFEQKQAFFDLESTDAYRRAITEPMMAQIAIVDDVAERLGVDPAELTDLIGQMADGYIAEDGSSLDVEMEAMLATASLRDKTRVVRASEEIISLLQKRGDMYADATQAYNEALLLEQEQRSRAAAEVAEARKAATEQVVGRLQEKLPFLAGLDGVDLKALTEEVGNIDASDQHAVDTQYQIAVAKLFPYVIRDYLTLQKEAEDLTARLGAYESAEPGAAPTPAGVDSKPTSGPAGMQVPSGAPGVLPQGQTFAQRVEDALAAQGFGGI